jgi:hypothetical protein
MPRYDVAMTTSNAVEVGGTIAVADLARYQYYHFHRRLWPAVILLVFAAAVSVPATVYLVITSNSEELRPLLANAAPFFFLLALWVGLPIVVPYWAAKKQYAAQCCLREPTVYLFDQNRIKVESESTSSSLAWSTIREIRETKSLFLLYHAPKIAMVLPKRFFDGDDELGQWRRLVTAAYPKGISKSSPVGRWC